jgi:uncharacterized protein YqeY
MTLSEQINKDYIEAYKAKDKVKVAAIRSVKPSLAELDKPGTPVPPAEYYKVLNKVIKQYGETASFAAQDGNDELVKASLSEAAILEAYIPKQLTEAEVEAKVKAIATENTLTFSKPNMGKLVKLTQTACEGQTDGKTVSTIINKLISEEEGKYGKGL